MIRIEDIANAAEIVVNGYAFTKEQKYIRVLNLNNVEKATLLASDGVVLETTMDDIELDIILRYFEKNQKYMEG